MVIGSKIPLFLEIFFRRICWNAQRLPTVNCFTTISTKTDGYNRLPVNRFLSQTGLNFC